MKHNFLLFVIALLAYFYACNNPKEPKVASVEKSINKVPDTLAKKTQTTYKIEPSKTAVVKQPQKTHLNGRWQSTIDQMEEWEFTDSDLKMYYKDEIVSAEKYDVTDKCVSEKTSVSEAEKYISTYDGQCYYIVKLDASALELSFVGRGNTLVFRRVQ